MLMLVFALWWQTAEGQPAQSPPLLSRPPLDVGHEVNGYLLVERMVSIPRTVALTGGIREPEEALALGGITQRLHALPGREDVNGTTVQLWLPDHAVSGAASAGPLLLAGRDARRFLALPGPFEEELLDELHTYRLHRRVNRGAHGEVWRAVRSDDP